MSSSPSFPVAFLIGSVYVYQRTISPDHGPLRWLFPAGVCRFTPTCSEYMVEALQQHGASGLLMGLRRLTRCHPYGEAL